jgi:hypothetical protein
MSLPQPLCGRCGRSRQARAMHKTYGLAACLPGYSEDCQRCGELLITARRPAVRCCLTGGGACRGAATDGLICTAEELQRLLAAVEYLVMRRVPVEVGEHALGLAAPASSIATSPQERLWIPVRHLGLGRSILRLLAMGSGAQPVPGPP